MKQQKLAHETDVKTEQSSLSTRPRMSDDVAFSTHLTSSDAGARQVRQAYANHAVIQRDDDTRTGSATYEGGDLEGDLSERIQLERRKGRPVNGGTKESAQRSLGYDLSLARVHDGPAAA